MKTTIIGPAKRVHRFTGQGFRFSGIGSTFKEAEESRRATYHHVQQAVEMALWQTVKKYRVVLGHVGVWVGFLLLWAITLVSANPGAKVNVLRMLVTFLPAAFTFYGSNFLFFTFLPRRKPLQLLAAEVVFFASCLLVLLLTVGTFRPMTYGKPADWPSLTDFLSTPLWRDTFWLYILLTALSLGYYYLRQSGKRSKEPKLTLEQKLEAEKGKLEAEYAFLRAQINPHFLHNTLNFFYAKSLGHSDELSDGILTLCDIMRYSLESEEDAKGTVLLTKEVEHLHNVIKINQLRFSHRLQIDFKIEGELDSLRIIPLVLITLVENAFKHGEMNDAQHPIQIGLEVQDNGEIKFSVANKKRKGPKETSHGIGLDNTRKRLAAAYPNAHQVQVQEDEEFYAITLTVQLPQSHCAKRSAAAVTYS
ncbi:hypothetical protein GU926_17565 [Nibribacter ruber]|uniref:Signal transduction histidine kinase internal region domain-containing protein n=1 Tax=Nibribacter ruber TaxID=2698458 RepID=A0A6P1P3Z9_9BACT|nr:histidine kinase [Nibribacter ruber]QHL89140.1 hypothetical protein GU926_17565 [Nibribacter ruber]